MPTQFLMRRVVREVSFHGQRMRPGQNVAFLYPSANRDPREFEEPDRFDVRRAPRRILSFGHGIHACIGQHFARAEARLCLMKLLDHAPEYDVRAERLRRIKTEFVQGWESMPVTLRLGRARSEAQRAFARVRAPRSARRSPRIPARVLASASRPPRRSRARRAPGWRGGGRAGRRRDPRRGSRRGALRRAHRPPTSPGPPESPRGGHSAPAARRPCARRSPAGRGSRRRCRRPGRDSRGSRRARRRSARRRRLRPQMWRLRRSSCTTRVPRTHCARSLSGVQITTGRRAVSAAAVSAAVASASSASCSTIAQTRKPAAARHLLQQLELRAQRRVDALAGLVARVEIVAERFDHVVGRDADVRRALVDQRDHARPARRAPRRSRGPARPAPAAARRSAGTARRCRRPGGPVTGSLAPRGARRVRRSFRAGSHL